MERFMWNPWHGCHKYSEGCKNCYMFAFDKERGVDSNIIYKTSSYNLPLKKKKDGKYKIPPNSIVSVCLTSDFFIEEADNWRIDAWQMMKTRKDIFFMLFTKRAERIFKCLPEDWGNGYENISINLTCENQKRIEERLPIFEMLPCLHKFLIVAPMIEKVNVEKYLNRGFLERVYCSGENYKNARICDYEWVQNLYEQCKSYNVDFEFFDTGNRFRKNGKIYFIPHSKGKEQALKSGLNFKKNES